MNNKDHTILERAEKAFSQDAIPKGPSEDLIRQTLAQIEKQQTTIPFMERIHKMKSISKFAAAAIVIVGISAIFLFNRAPGSIALADVYARVQQAQAFMYKMSMTMTGSMMEGMPTQDTDMEATITISTEYGVKYENKMHIVMGDEDKTMTQQMYVLPNQKTMVMVMQEEKKYMRMEFSEDLLERTKKQNNDPREMLKQLMKCEYEDLGFSDIDGIKVQGFRSTDPTYFGGMTGNSGTVTIWIDTKTWLPVRTEMDFMMGESMKAHGVITDYQWDVQVASDEFTPVIPEDYQELASVALPKMDKNAAIEGLKLFSDLTGSYPEKIDVMTLMTKEMAKVKDSTTEAAIEFKQRMSATGTEEEKAQMAIQQMMPLQSLGMFYATLLQDRKDVAYYGDQITPDDVDAVLMRWKLDNGKYMVIFGDLTSVEMEYDDMIKIEPPANTAEPESSQP